MSRLARKPINIPDNVEISMSDDSVLVRGPKGELIFKLPAGLGVIIENKKVKLQRISEDKNSKSFLGMSVRMINNMIKGAVDGYEKKLEISGVGYKANVQGEELSLDLGFSHSVNLKIPKKLTVSVSKNLITVAGADKKSVGEFAANIKRIRPPEPYGGKGIKYEGERIKRKISKKATAASSS